MLRENNLALGVERAAAEATPIAIGHQKHGSAVGVSTADVLGGADAHSIEPTLNGDVWQA